MDLEKAIFEIQDTLVVMANIEARMSRARLQEHEIHMTTLDIKLAEITGKLNCLINFVQRQHRFPEMQ